MINSKINIDHDLEYFKFDNFFKKVKNQNSLKYNGIYIFGIPGVGKTNFIYKFLEKTQGTISEAINSSSWINEYMKSWNSENGFEGINVTTPERLANKNILIIDDLGSEFIHESTLVYIYRLFDERAKFLKNNKKAITILTSNFNLKELENIYSKKDKMQAKRIISRLNEIINLNVHFEGIDKRISKTPETKIFESIDF